MTPLLAVSKTDKRSLLYIATPMLDETDTGRWIPLKRDAGKNKKKQSFIPLLAGSGGTYPVSVSATDQAALKT